MFEMLKNFLNPKEDDGPKEERRPFIYDTKDVIDNKVDDIISVYADADSILFPRTSRKKK